MSTTRGEEPAPDHIADTGNMVPTRAEALRGLADRVEAGEIGDKIEREIMPLLGARDEPWDDCDIWMITLRDVVPSKIICNVGSLCTSLDAVSALQEAVLPGWRLTVVQYPDKMRVRLLAPNFGGSCAGDGTLCQAWLAAILRALAVEADNAG